MPVPDDFAVFILTHGRADRVITVRTLLGAGYTGAWHLLIDDEDSTAEDYRRRYPEPGRVVQFSKEEAAGYSDAGNNFGDRRTPLFARNAVHRIAKELGYRHYLTLDDDYTTFYLRNNSEGVYGSYKIRTTFDDVVVAMLRFLDASPFVAVASSQGGDHIGGGGRNARRMARKCMNAFFCDVERDLVYQGVFNDDVNTYSERQRRGRPMATVLSLQVNQPVTQSNAGGITELYLRFGTYVKSATTLMYCPSATRIGSLWDPRSPNPRIHHQVRFRNVAPLLLHERHRKPDPEDRP